MSKRDSISKLASRWRAWLRTSMSAAMFIAALYAAGVTHGGLRFMWLGIAAIGFVALMLATLLQAWGPAIAEMHDEMKREQEGRDA